MAASWTGRARPTLHLAHPAAKRRRVASVVAGLGAVVLAQPVLSAAAVTRVPASRSHAATVTADVKYFAGKTVNFVLGGAPGSTNYNAAQALIPGMEAYLKCTVVLDDNPNGNSISAENLAYAQPPNGLWIGYLGVGGALSADLQGQTSINFAIKHVEGDIVMGSPQGNYVLVASPSSGIKNMGDLFNLASKVYMLGTGTGTGNVVERMLVGLWPKLKVSILTGYTSSSEIAGFNRGDGPLALVTPPQIATEVTGGVAIPILVQNKPPGGSVIATNLAHVPTFAQFAAKYPVKGAYAQKALQQALLWFTAPAYAFFMPPGTPMKYQLAITDAMKYATRLPATKQQQLAGGVPPGFYSPDQTRAIIASEVKNDQYIGHYLNS